MLNSLLTNANDKLNYAIKKVFKNIEKAIHETKTDYNRKIEDARIKYASTYPIDHPEVEKRGLLITNENGNYSYTPTATTAFNEETRPINDAFEKSIIEVEPYYAGQGTGFERVATIDMFIKEELIGLLFDPLAKDALIEDKPKAQMHIEHKVPVPLEEKAEESPVGEGIPIENELTE